MALLICEEEPGLASFTRFAIFNHLDGRRDSLLIDAEFLYHENGHTYLPVDIISRGKDWVLIELSDEANSGTRRLWVAPSALSSRQPYQWPGTRAGQSLPRNP